ncbi:MAG TPA: DUF3500 domain-containing protein [Planctomycetota bacterium]
MNRRRALQLGAGLGALTGAGLLARYRLLPPRPSRVLEGVDVLARRFHDSLDEEQRATSCVEYDHPLRQYHNRGVWGGGRGIFLGFDRAQRALLSDLLHAGLSDAGRARVPEEYYTRWPGVHSMRVLLCGDPGASPWQMILTGAHVNLRLGGKSREGVAFGGPQVYGDQRGNGVAGLPGNLYREQFLLAQQLLRGLDPGRRRAATLPEAPVQTQIEVRGRSATPPGIPVAELGTDERALVRRLVETILSTWPPQDVRHAQECLEANGGIAALHFASFEHGEDGPIPEGQVFRLEGPAAVFHFRGHPHVHAFVNVALDGEAPLSVGEPLGENPRALEGDAVKALFERALRAETGADLAHYPRASVVGRLRAGAIRSGDVYVLESWQETAVVAGIRGANLGPHLRAQLAELGRPLEPQRVYAVATTGWALDDGAQDLGRIETRREERMLRDLTVAHLRARGFAGVERPG